MHKELQPEAKNCYYDAMVGHNTWKLLPGEFEVLSNDDMLVTTLGSCIAACLYDSSTGIGGMNHFMLPTSSSGDWAGVSAATRYGNYAMEHLINEMLKQGAFRQNIVAKFFGGSILGSKEERVGDNNANFARDYLLTEDIRILAEDVGGNFSRKVYFHPRTGKVTVKRLTIEQNNTIETRERSYAQQLTETPIESEIILF